MSKSFLSLALGLSFVCAQASAQTSKCSDADDCRQQLKDYGYRNTIKNIGVTTSTIDFKASTCTAPVATVVVTVDLKHTSVGDLDIKLTSPDGSVVALLYSGKLGVGDSLHRCKGDDVGASFDDGGEEPSCPVTIPALSGALLPLTPLRSFAGQPRTGVWKLTIEDSVGGGYGVLNDWSISMPCELPRLSAMAKKGVASESAPGIVTFTRTKPYDAPLRVRYDLGGTAENPTDFALSPAALVIAAGAASADLSITPKASGAGKTLTVTPTVGNFTTDEDAAPVTIRFEGDEPPAVCGNTVQEPGEACDDGNTTSGDGCDENCTVTACGNGIVTKGEACDDGNRVGNDKCDNTCRVPSGCSGAEPTWLAALAIALFFAWRKRTRAGLALGLIACAPATDVAPLRAVACNEKTCVAVGDTILSSSDGKTWTEHTREGGWPALHAVAVGPSGFVAVAQTGELLSSPDGEHWTDRAYATEAQPASSLYSIRWTGDRFCAGTGTPDLLVSSDGARWTRQRVADGIGTQDCAFGNGTHVVIASPNVVYTAEDGVAYTERSVLGGFASKILFANDLFVTYVAAEAAIYSSLDAQTWTVTPLGREEMISSITYGHGLFTAVGQGGLVLSSPDAVRWTDRSPAERNVALQGAAVFFDPVLRDPFEEKTVEPIVVMVGEDARTGKGAFVTLRQDY